MGPGVFTDMDYASQLLRGFEGFRETPYWDVNAYRVGYGSDTVTLADGSVVPVTQGMSVTRADAERDLQRRLSQEFTPRLVNAIGQDVYSQITPEQQAALLSITYNYGSLPGSVAQALQTGDPNAAAAAIRALATHNDGVNADRRNREADIFAGITPITNTRGGNVPPQPSGAMSQPNALAATQPPPAAPMNALAQQRPAPPQWQNALNVADFLRPTNALTTYGFQPGMSPYLQG
jgi:GH24 family phage-related lysozyme (muramidase)